VAILRGGRSAGASAANSGRGMVPVGAARRVGDSKLVARTGRTLEIGAGRSLMLVDDAAPVVGDERHALGASSDVGVRPTESVRGRCRMGSRSRPERSEAGRDDKERPAGRDRPDSRRAVASGGDSAGADRRRCKHGRLDKRRAGDKGSDRFARAQILRRNAARRRSAVSCPGSDWILQLVRRPSRSPRGALAGLDRGHSRRNLDPARARRRNERPLFSA
jgi:hypothetical protein